MTKSQFARRHTYEALTEAEQIAFCKEMLTLWREALVGLHGLKDQHDFAKSQAKFWNLERKDVERHAIEAGLAYHDPQEFEYEAKAAYTQIRQMCKWK